MSWRTRRQLVTFLILALMAGGIGFWLYPKFLSKPTCFDERKNQRELGIDCGGPCESCEIQNPKSITVFWAKVVPIRINLYDVAAEIRNENEVLSSARVEYEFILFDNLTPVAIKSGRTFVFPQETLHVIEANLNTSREPTRIEFRITNIDWLAEKIQRPNIIVERRDYMVLEDGFRRSAVEAEILNRSPFDFREVEVRFILLDSAGNLVGANRILVENLRSGERKTVRSLWPLELPGKSVQIIVEPRVNIFDASIILRPQ